MTNNTPILRCDPHEHDAEGAARMLARRNTVGHVTLTVDETADHSTVGDPPGRS
jgi:hypothetical protein